MNASAMRVVISGCLVFGCAGVAAGQCQTGKLLPASASDNDQFGYAVAVSGDRAVIGERFDDDNGQDSGSATVFRFDGLTWAIEQKLTADDGEAGDWFGQAVAIAGDTIIIGAPREGTAGVDAGAAYVFDYDGQTWTQVDKIIATDAAPGDWFGASVAMDGLTAVIGAEKAAPNGDNSGAAYVYDSDGFTWTETTKLFPSDGEPSDRFGFNVDIDGDLIIGGTFGDDDNGQDAGSATVFRFDGLAWVEEAKLVADDGAAGDRFGIAVGISGDAAVVGADMADQAGIDSGSVYVFRFDGAQWAREQELAISSLSAGDRAGTSVVIAGATVLVGSPMDNAGQIESGSVTVHTYDTTTWAELTKLTAADMDTGDHFGSDVALDIDTAAIGADRADEPASDSGSAYTFAATGAGTDCNNNGVCDSDDIDSGFSLDCNNNNTPDECDLAAGTSLDCNNNGIPDECDISAGTSEDCNNNGVPDECDLSAGTSLDCNSNGIPDECDISDGTSLDCNSNGIPDECDISAGTSEDCNSNGVPDECDIATGTSEDCDGNEIPDECDTPSFSDQSPQLGPIGDGFPQTYTLTTPPDAGIDVTLSFEAIGDLSALAESIDVFLNGQNLGTLWQTGGNDCPTEPDTAQLTVDPQTYNDLLDAGGGDAVFEMVASSAVNSGLCTDSYITILIEYQPSTAVDCDANGVPDICDLILGDLHDNNGNTIPDECECRADFNGDGEANSVDFIAFLNAFTAGDPAADFDFDGEVNSQDFIAFLNAFVEGC